MFEPKPGVALIGSATSPVEQRPQFDHVLREILRGLVEVLAQGLAEDRRGARRAAEPEIDPARGTDASSVPNCSAITKGLWLGSMIPPDPMRMVLGRMADMGEHHRGRAAGDPFGRMVLGHPEALVAAPPPRPARSPPPRPSPRSPRCLRGSGRGRGRKAGSLG